MSLPKSTVNSLAGCHQKEKKTEEETKGMIYLHHILITYN